MSGTSDPTCVLCGTALERVRYFPRQLITADDMRAEQEFILNKMRRHNRFLHGWGVVCGCKVVPMPTDQHPWQVQVCPGWLPRLCGSAARRRDRDHAMRDLRPAIRHAALRSLHGRLAVPATAGMALRQPTADRLSRGALRRMCDATGAGPPRRLRLRRARLRIFTASGGVRAESAVVAAHLAQRCEKGRRGLGRHGSNGDKGSQRFRVSGAALPRLHRRSMGGIGDSAGPCRPAPSRHPSRKKAGPDRTADFLSRPARALQHDGAPGND